MSGTVIHERRRAVLSRLGAAWRAAVQPPLPEPADGRVEPAGSADGSLGAGHRHQDALAVLTATRAVVQRGWTQNTWYVLRSPAGRRRTVQSIFPGRLDRSRIVEACLVGAVVHAAWQQSPRPEHAYPAVDALWHTLFGGGAADGDPVGPLSSPPVRVSRVRDLTTWNDRPYRTRDDVLDLLDRAADRVSRGTAVR